MGRGLLPWDEPRFLAGVSGRRLGGDVPNAASSHALLHPPLETVPRPLLCSALPRMIQNRLRTAGANVGIALPRLDRGAQPRAFQYSVRSPPRQIPIGTAMPRPGTH